jgi:hypothetical protein
MNPTTPNSWTAIAAVAAGALSDYLGSSKIKTVDLHGDKIDPQGRVDVLVARVFRLAVQRANDPGLQELYDQLHPVIDHHLHRALGKMRPHELFVGGGVKGPRRNPARKTTRKMAAKRGAE